MKIITLLVLLTAATLAHAQYQLEYRTNDNRVVGHCAPLGVCQPQPGNVVVEITTDQCLALDGIPNGYCAIWSNNAVASAPVPQVPSQKYADYWWMRNLAGMYLPWPTNVTVESGVTVTNSVEPWPCTQDALLGAITTAIDNGWPEHGCQADRAYVLATWPSLPEDLTITPPATVNAP